MKYAIYNNGNRHTQDFNTPEEALANAPDQTNWPEEDKFTPEVYQITEQKIPQQTLVNEEWKILENVDDQAKTVDRSYTTEALTTRRITWGLWDGEKYVKIFNQSNIGTYPPTLGLHTIVELTKPTQFESVIIEPNELTSDDTITKGWTTRPETPEEKTAREAEEAERAKEQTIKSSREGLAEQFRGLPANVRGPFRPIFDAAVNLLDEDDAEAAVECVKAQQVPSGLIPTKDAFVAALEQIRDA